ncbi:MAG: two-component sensor histidine kinase [Burkholderiales bacterium]|nr:two-component sensor histidine kinase [Burkholderiales bacterium]
MYPLSETRFGEWPAYDRRRKETETAAPAMSQLHNPAQRFDLIRWISILGLVSIMVASIPFAAILSHFMTNEILEHDASLTGRFIVSVAETQTSQANLGNKVALGQILDQRANLEALGVDPQVAASVRQQFYDHLRFLPDVLQADVIARDRKLIWSTNHALVGQIENDSAELEKAFTPHAMRATARLSAVGRTNDANEHLLPRQAGEMHVDDYVQLYDAHGEVAAVARIHKDLGDLVQSIDRGNVLVWVCTALGAAFLYLTLFWIIRRADAMLKAQHQRLVETEALCIIGEMSAAVAHGIRNPLASMRSSAELALDGDLESTRKNATDIIFQIDRLGKWVRDLLAFSRPLDCESRKINLVTLVEDCLPSFSAQLERCRISCEFVQPPAQVPLVLGARGLATQALASVIANAIEAMPAGGTLRLELEHEPHSRCVAVVVSDTGTGMSPAAVEMVFKPYYTTKCNGLGLGMALVKRIMERFGGAISLHSRLGEGTRVNLNFPLAQ